MSDEPVEKDERLETVTAILIAVITVIGALTAWRAYVAEDNAGDADYGGLRAAVNVEETRALNYVDAYESYSAYTSYRRYADMGDMLAEAQTKTTDEDELALLERERADAHDLATTSQELFPNRFLNRDGSYNVDRQLGEAWADAAQEMDLNPDPQFAEADKMRVKTFNLLLAVSVQAFSLVFLTLIESVSGRMRYVLLSLGILCALAGMVAALVVEFTV